VPLIHRLDELYKTIYLLGHKIPKRDRFGLHANIESVCLNILELIITAALEARENKKQILNTARIKIEVLKRLIRAENELNIIPAKTYLELELQLQEVSKMTNGWIKYLA